MNLIFFSQREIDKLAKEEEMVQTKKMKRFVSCKLVFKKNYDLNKFAE
jgi:hypothetical protein